MTIYNASLLYISGPISGLTSEEARSKFSSAALLLRNRAYETLDPHDVGACEDTSCDGKEDPSQPDGWLHSWECYLKYDLIEMLKCDGVALLDNWEESRGARLEWNTAKELSIPAHTVHWWINNAEEIRGWSSTEI